MSKKFLIIIYQNLP